MTQKPHLNHELERDPRLTAALRHLEERISPAEADRLRAAIVAAARPALMAIRERNTPWWEWTSRWRRVVVPAGLAASLAAGVLVARSDLGRAGLADATATSVHAMVLSAATMATGAELVTSELVLPLSRDGLMGSAIGGETGELPGNALADTTY
jgi:hypothetical protein